MLDGRAQFFSKGNPNNEHTVEIMEKARTYKEMYPHTDKRIRSIFDGSYNLYHRSPEGKRMRENYH